MDFVRFSFSRLQDRMIIVLMNESIQLNSGRSSSIRRLWNTSHAPTTPKQPTRRIHGRAAYIRRRGNDRHSFNTTIKTIGGSACPHNCMAGISASLHQYSSSSHTSKSQQFFSTKYVCKKLRSRSRSTHLNLSNQMFNVHIHTHNLVKLINCYALGMHSLWDLLSVCHIAVPKKKRKSKQTFMTANKNLFCCFTQHITLIGWIDIENEELKIIGIFGILFCSNLNV